MKPASPVANSAQQNQRQQPPLPDPLMRLRPAKLPVDPRVRTAALQKLLSPHGSADQVAHILHEDPVLVLQVIYIANQSLTVTDNEVKTLGHAISLIGFPRIEQLLRRAVVYDDVPAQQVEALRRQMAISMHAAQLMPRLAGSQTRWQTEGLELATLLQAAPVWALWLHSQELMQEIDNARIEKPEENHELLEEKLLGHKIPYIAGQLGKMWQLPRLAQESWQSDRCGNEYEWMLLSRIKPEQATIQLEQQQALQAIVNRAATGVALANRFAQEADRDWHSRYSLRLQKTLACCLAVDLPSLIALTHQEAANSPVLPGIQHCAHQLLGHYRRLPVIKPEVQVENNADMSSAQAAPPPASEKTLATNGGDKAAGNNSNNSPTLARYVQQLRNQPESIHSLNELFEQSLQLLCEELGLDRSCVLLIHGASRELRTFHSVGCEDSTALRRFRYRFQPGDLFDKLLQKTLGLHIQPESYARISPLLPTAFKRACASNHFFMMSVFAGDKPLGILFGDNARQHKALTEGQYRQFKQLCLAIGQCIASRA